MITDAEVAAAMEIAQASAVRVCAHARSAESVKMCVRHGLGIIYHANFADEEALDRLEANRDWCFVVPPPVRRRAGVHPDGDAGRGHPDGGRDHGPR